MGSNNNGRKKSTVAAEPSEKITAGGKVPSKTQQQYKTEEKITSPTLVTSQVQRRKITDSSSSGIQGVKLETTPASRNEQTINESTTNMTPQITPNN